MGAYIDRDELLELYANTDELDISNYDVKIAVIRQNILDMPTVDIVPCKECKHRPVKEDPNGEDYGFNLVGPNEEDDVCPCLVEDGWYSWMPEDNFHCGRGERIDNERRSDNNIYNLPHPDNTVLWRER